MNPWEIPVEEKQVELLTKRETVSIRPYRMGEERILLMGADSDSSSDLYLAVVQVIKNTVKFKTPTIVDDLPFVEIAWLMYNLRLMSKGSLIQFDLTCENEKCKKHESSELAEYDLTKIVSVEGEKFLDSTIIFDKQKKYGIELMFSNFSYLSNLKDQKKKPIKVANLELFESHIRSVLLGDERFELDTEGKKKFIDDLNEAQYQKILDWFKKEPKIVMDFTWNCPECKSEIHFRTGDPILFLAT